ncbi:MAG: DUF2125 domain-containing protein [Paracoccus denitrificans]|nr:MAG: DUF2125 domain-containing protein [Paracoccus denitrificans]PZO85824.1 MAG: DUF2125 domain-containing protein [Paracoccus denitrificans]
MFLKARTSAIALMAMSVPALADVTPAEVWQNSVDFYKANGYEVAEGAREEAGDTLIVKDVVLSQKTEGGTLNVTIPEVNLKGTGDGKVTTTMSDTSSIVGAFKTEDDKNVDVKATIKMPGATTVSSGDKADMTHQATLPQLAITVDEVKTGDKTLANLLTITGTDASYTQHIVTTDANTKADIQGAVASLNAKVDVDSKDDEGQPVVVKADWTVQNLQSSGTSTIPANVNISENVDAAIKAGLDGDGTFQAGESKLVLNMDVPNEEDGTQRDKIDANVDTAAITGTFKVAADGLTYLVDTDGIKVAMTTNSAPFPINFAMDSVTTGLQFPIQKSDTPAPFKLNYELAGVTMGDEIWNLFDSQKKLPRDPMSLAIDLTGAAKVNVDILDPAAMQALEDGTQADGTPDPSDTTAPAEDADVTDGTDTTNTDTTDADVVDTPEPFAPTELTINQIALSGLGAKINAEGELKAPEGGTLETPIGTINARYEGLNTLLGKLVEAQLVPEDQLSGIRMMMAMFAKPAEGNDVLTTDLEFKEGGSIFANGQQIK